MVRVKICGITNWTDAKLASDAGAHALGFNFYPSSPRCITPARAWSIIRRLPPFVEAVGVFVNWSFSAVTVLADALRLSAVQLHGDESPRLVSAFAGRLPAVKAFNVGRGFRPARLARYRRAAAFLLDGFDRGMRGGTGKQFDWSMARQAKQYGRIILAGGLGPENVAQAILEVEPYGIDVCSGVEAKPGKKDPARLRELMREVEIANRELRQHGGHENK